MMFRFIAVLSVLWGCSFTTYADKSECQQQQCLAVIDAGSSGSRLHVFAYDRDSNNTPIKITEIWSRKIVPGLAAIEHEHRSISTYLDKLFTDAPTVSMPVYLYATGGMRLLPKPNHKYIYQMITNWFEKQYYWRLTTARTISGNEEGVFAWLATNYQLNLLNQDEQPLVGTLDIGGASVQVALPITNETDIPKKDIVSIHLYGRNYTIFAHSFLGLGQNEMNHQFVNLKACFPIAFELPSGELGQGDAQACKKEITTLVNTVHHVNQTIKSVLALNPLKDWYILGGITNLLNDKMFPFPKQQFNNQDLIQYTDKNICHQTWQSLEQTFPNNPLIYNYCILSAYLYALLINGYSLQASQPIHLMPPNKNSDWTLGVVLQHPQT